ncbi:MAG: hypothetical protein JST91_13580 [Actinobacteria bacterium]|nr:hypothetical protein [Actinomycetota bacterium]
MTTADEFRSRATPGDSVVLIAGAPWPMYKLVALAIGFLVLVVVGVATTSAGPAVLAAAGTSTLVWVILGAFAPRR